jgi:hypothetical protein
VDKLAAKKIPPDVIEVFDEFKQMTRKWTADEVDHLHNEYPAGVRLKVIAKQLGRSVASVFNKAVKDGLCDDRDIDTSCTKVQDDSFQRAMTKAIENKFERVEKGVKVNASTGDFYPEKFNSPYTPGLRSSADF